MDRTYVAENDAERERLRSLVTGSSDEELGRPMPAGWTVAAVLAHIGFWDAPAIFWLDKWDAALSLRPTRLRTSTRRTIRPNRSVWRFGRVMQRSSRSGSPRRQTDKWQR